jgi:alkylation response protein AidB-like acyl-CoA dehydrogenase
LLICCPASQPQRYGHDRDASFPHDSLAALHGQGLLALTVPAALGGGSVGLRVAAQVVAWLGAACPATALVVAMQYLKHAALARSPAWPETLRERVQRDAVTEGALINSLRVEADFGSPTCGGLPATIARRTVTGWEISGRKRYATGAPGLRWLCRVSPIPSLSNIGRSSGSGCCRRVNPVAW